MENCFSSKLYSHIMEEIRESIKDNPNYTQASLAKLLGVRREHLNRMLSNKYPMKAEQMVYLIKILGIKDLL